MTGYVDAHHHIWRQADLPWLGGPMQPRIFGPYESIRRDYTIAEWTDKLMRAGFAIDTLRTWRLRMDFPVWTARMATPQPLVDAIRVPNESMYRAGNKLIWVLVILFAGFIGAIVYFAIGRPAGGRRSGTDHAWQGPPPPPPPGSLG